MPGHASGIRRSGKPRREERRGSLWLQLQRTEDAGAATALPAAGSRCSGVLVAADLNSRGGPGPLGLNRDSDPAVLYDRTWHAVLTVTTHGAGPTESFSSIRSEGTCTCRLEKRQLRLPVTRTLVGTECQSP